MMFQKIPRYSTLVFRNVIQQRESAEFNQVREYISIAQNQTHSQLPTPSSPHRRQPKPPLTLGLFNSRNHRMEYEPYYQLMMDDMERSARAHHKPQCPGSNLHTVGPERLNGSWVYGLYLASNAAVRTGLNRLRWVVNSKRW